MPVVAKLLKVSFAMVVGFGKHAAKIIGGLYTQLPGEHGSFHTELSTSFC